MPLTNRPNALKDFLLECGKSGHAAACRKHQISKASYYRLVDKVVARTCAFDQAQPAESLLTASAQNRGRLTYLVLDLLLKHPSWGCSKIKAALAQTVSVSAPTIQKSLIGLGLGTRKARLEWFAQKVIDGEILNLTDAQRAAVLEVDPSALETLA